MPQNPHRVSDMSKNYAIQRYVKDSLSILDESQRRVFLWLSILRTVVFGLDIGAILLLTSGLSSFSSQDGAAGMLMVSTAALGMLLRSLLTLLISRSTFRFLSRVEVIAGGEFTETVFSSAQEKLDAFRTQDVSFALNQGTNSFTTRTLGFFLILLSDGVALIALVTVFAVVYPVEGALMILLVISIVVPVQRSVNRRIHDSASEWSTATINMLQKIQEFQTARREIYLNSAERSISFQLGKYRNEAAESSARFNFMLTIPRTVIEVATLIVAALLLAVASLRMSTDELIVFSGMLMAIVFRVAPLAIGVVGSIGVITQSLGETTINRRLLTDIGTKSPMKSPDIPTELLDESGPAIEIKSLTYTFPGASTPVLQNVDVTVLPNEVCAIIGQSGSGKTTLLDCIMGLRELSHGSIQLFGLDPNEVRRRFPGSIGLVIQTPSIKSASIAENVAFFSSDGIDRKLVLDLLIRVGLQSFVEQQNKGIDALVGEGNLQMSGGEKQRLALARALYRNPKVLIMDEPTSALDGLSELQVFDLIEKERINRTIVLVTHRQPSSMFFDRVYEVQDGKVSTTSQKLS
jgi:ABC-type bacteriocin/lantibiotic exporter with double-glycine peptidase domain